jgi:hypothetical protein
MATSEGGVGSERRVEEWRTVGALRKQATSMEISNFESLVLGWAGRDERQRVGLGR